MRAAFLDRDGVLNRRPPPHEYVGAVDALDVLPGTAAAVIALREAGYLPVVVSNQRGVARGLVTEAVLSEIEEHLAAEGVDVAAYYYCRHDLDAACTCRKPQPGLLLRAAHELGLDLSSSVMIGDEESDVEAGRAAGCRTIRIGVPAPETAADAVAPNLCAAVALLARQATASYPSTNQ
jgi:D-glycero-D-manno-heptose 1,7-bisphosphate phosphatase